MNFYNDFINVLPVTKTIQVEAIPDSRTKRYIEENGLIDIDEECKNNMDVVKTYVTDYHRSFIQTVLESFEFKEETLEKYRNLYSNKTDDNKEEFDKLCNDMREAISNAFKNDSYFSYLDKKEMILKLLPEFLSDNDEALEVISLFNKRTGSFTEFGKHKMFMYSDENKHGTIGYRLISENLPIFVKNLEAYEKITASGINYFDELEETLSIKVSNYFSLNGFNKTLTQDGIDIYNTIIGGISKEDGSRIQGLNEIVNLYNQENKTKLPKFRKLNKQILSIKNTKSYVYEKYKIDDDVFAAIKEMYGNLITNVIDCVECTGIRDIVKLSNFDIGRIYLKKDFGLTNISSILYGKWDTIYNAVKNHYDIVNGKKRGNADYEGKREENFNKAKQYSVAELLTYIDEYGLDPSKLMDYFAERVAECICNIKNAYLRYSFINRNKYSSETSLKTMDDDKRTIQKLMDAIKELQNVVKPFCISENAKVDRDTDFYTKLDNIFDTFHEVNTVYNKVRNYVTSKPYSDDSIHIYFNFNPETFLGGWSYSVEGTKHGQIYIKDGKYYLGIANNRTGWVNKIPAAKTNNVYKKMVTYTIGDAKKQIPKNVDGWKNLKTDSEKIDAAKQWIYSNENCIDCNPCFKETDEYSSYDEFIKDAGNQLYYMKFVDVDASFIDEKIANGKLLMFELYIKKMSKHSHGAPSPILIFLRTLFSDNNITNPYIKINGNAKLMLRKASLDVKDTTIHEAGKPIENRNKLNSQRYSVKDHDIIKDRRFCYDKFTFHLTLNINCNGEGNPKNRYDLNTMVNKSIYIYRNGTVMGIDRGENNLVYITIVDFYGNILFQKSFNVITSIDPKGNMHITDYLKMLKEIEEENEAARKEWRAIKKSKDLKHGYCGKLVHEIKKLAHEYNCVMIVMEKLDDKFKNKRKKIDHQVYTECEKTLTNSFKFDFNKRKDVDEDGGLRKAYTLTTEYKPNVWQNGIIHYIPPEYTSKIDPTTGFVNLFYTKYENISTSRQFISSFDRICFDRSKQMYRFDFDYLNFKYGYKVEKCRSNWTAYSNGYRISGGKKYGFKRVELTQEFDKLFEEYGIDKYKDDLREDMLAIDKADFYQRFMNTFYLVVKMRDTDYSIDRIISPVLNSRDDFFETDMYDNMPIDGDANGSYCIALKGLMKINKILESDPDNIPAYFEIKTDDWFRFMQNRASELILEKNEELTA